MATADELIAEALEAPVWGWDFSWLDGRAEEARPPWDYSAIVREATASSRRMLDVDTGGGEFLARLAPFPGSVVATEGHAPNVAVAHERLGPLGIPVVETASAPDNVDQGETSPETSRSGLPFASDAFDVSSRSSGARRGPAGPPGRISSVDLHTRTDDSTGRSPSASSQTPGSTSPGLRGPTPR